MKKVIFGLMLMSTVSAFANDLRQEFANATALTKLNDLKTFEVKDKYGEVISEGGNWSCEGSFKRLAFVPLTSKRWWSPKTSAEIIQLREGKVTGLSNTSSKEIAFRKTGNSIVVEFSTGFEFKDAQESLEDSERFATSYAKCSPIARP